MLRIYPIGLMVLLLAALPAFAQTEITVGNHPAWYEPGAGEEDLIPVWPDQEVQLIPIKVTGGELIAGIDLTVTIGDGDLRVVDSPIFKPPEWRAINDNGTPADPNDDYFESALPNWAAGMLQGTIWDNPVEVEEDFYQYDGRDDFLDPYVDLPSPTPPRQDPYPYPELFLGTVVTNEAVLEGDEFTIPEGYGTFHIAADGVLVNMVIDTSGFSTPGATWDMKLNGTITVDDPDNPGDPLNADILTQLLQGYEVDPGPPIEYGIQAVAPVTTNNGRIRIVSTLTSQNDGSWVGDANTWTGGETHPTVFHYTEVAGHKVTVDTDSESFAVSITDSAGKIVVEPTRTLRVYDSAEVGSGTLRAGVSGTDGGKLQVAGELNLDAADDALELEWVPGGDASSKFEGNYEIASYGSRSGTFDAAGSPTGASGTDLTDFSIGSNYIDEINYDDANGKVELLLHALINGDSNLDGDVDPADFQKLQLSYGGPGSWRNGDFTFDGIVNAADFQQLQLNYGADLGGKEAAAFAVPMAQTGEVPEPGTLALLVTALTIGGLMAARRKRFSNT